MHFLTEMRTRAIVSSVLLALSVALPQSTVADNAVPESAIDANARWTALRSLATLNESRGYEDKAEQNYRDLLDLDRKVPSCSLHFADDSSRLLRMLIRSHKVDEAAKMVDPLIAEWQAGNFGRGTPLAGTAQDFESAGKIDAAEQVLREELRCLRVAMRGVIQGPVDYQQRKLCEFLARNGKLEEAISLARVSYESQKSGPNRWFSSDVYEHLLKQAGRTSEIEKLHKEAEQYQQDQRKASGIQADEKLAQLRSARSADSNEVIKVLLQRATLYLQEWKYDQAKPLIDEILLRLKKDANFDLNMESEIDSLAYHCNRYGHADESQTIRKALFDKIVSMACKSDASQQSNFSLISICNDFQRDNLQKTLEPMLKNALKKLQSVGDSTLVAQADVLANLASLYHSEQDLPEAEECEEQMISVLSKKSESPCEVAWNRLKLASTYLSNDKQAEAGLQSKLALATLHNPSKVEAYFDRAISQLWELSEEYRRKGIRDQADLLMKEAILIPLANKEASANGDQNLINMHSRRGVDPLDSALSAYHASGEDSRAEAILNELLQKTRQLAPDSNQVQGYELRLSDIYLNQGNLDKSQTLFNQALREYEKREGASGASIRFALQRRAILLRQNFHSKEADQIEARLKAIKHG